MEILYKGNDVDVFKETINAAANYIVLNLRDHIYKENY